MLAFQNNYLFVYVFFFILGPGPRISHMLSKHLAGDPYPKAFIISLLLINVFIVQQRVGPSATTVH